MVICRANPEDHRTLTKITYLSKGHWGYSEAQMEFWSNDLTITPEYIECFEVFKFVVENEIVAYYSYCHKNDKKVELDNLFLLPKHIGKGMGRILLLDFLERIKNEDANEVIVYSDPHSEGFYRHFGFEVIEQIETTIEGRVLPCMKRML